MAEVPASGSGSRAFMDVSPKKGGPDAQAQSEGWVRSDAERGFRLEHWEYERDRVDGFDYDIGAVLIKAVDATDESELLTVLDAWGVRPGLFVYPWESEDPR